MPVTTLKHTHPESPTTPRRALRKEITVILAFKIIIIIIAGFTIFGAKNRIHVDKEGMTNQLLKSSFAESILTTR